MSILSIYKTKNPYVKPRNTLLNKKQYCYSL